MTLPPALPAMLLLPLPLGIMPMLMLLLHALLSILEAAPLRNILSMITPAVAVQFTHLHVLTYILISTLGT